LFALAVCLALIAVPLARAQAPAASGNVAPAPTPAVLEALVGRIALYPDDLVAIILPASTNPLQVIQAERFLDKRKQNPKLPIDDRWDDSVKALVNYPEVIKQMSGDLDWMAELGEAVVADQGAVLDAVQAFRRKVHSAGNLKTDTKQEVVVEKEIIKIVPADPQVIYVPQYEPSTVVVYSAAPVYGYWPAPYPVYYYPYPPGAALATGLVWGAAIGAAWNGGRWNTSWEGGHNNITVNRGDVNINRNNVGSGNVNRPSQQPAGGGTAWKSDKRPGQVAGGTGRATATTTRVGDARAAGGDGIGGASTAAATRQAGGSADRAATTRQSGSAFEQGTASRDRSTSTNAGADAATRNVAGGGSRDAFDGYGSGSAARADSSRGATSRTSMSSTGARAGAGGGGARGGGGGFRGGGGGRGR
jgi:hypothetical protein